MQPNQLQAQATQAAQQGQQMLRSDLANKANYQNQYNTYNNQANQANQQVQQYANYMKGAGSGTNLYNTGKSQAFQEMGFDPASLATATQNLIRSQNAMGALQQASQSSLGGYGLSGAQLGNMYASQSAPLANTIQAQQNTVGGLQGLYQNALTNANQYAGAGLQGEQITADTLNKVFQNAANQRDAAAQQMQFYGTLAQQQGGLNAQQAQGYAAALNAYRQSQAAIAQAGLFGAQAAQIQQQMKFYGQAQANAQKQQSQQQKANKSANINQAMQAAQAADQAQKAATLRTQQTSGAFHGLDKMNLFSWLGI